MTGHHQRPGGGGHQHQAAHPGRVPDGELLREPASPGDAQDVGLLVAELVEQAAQQRRQRPQVVRHDRLRRPADARHVEPDDFPLRVDRVDEWLQQFKAGADAVAQHKRRRLPVPAPHGDPQDPATDGQRPHLLARSRPPPAPGNSTKPPGRGLFPAAPSPARGPAARHFCKPSAHDASLPGRTAKDPGGTSPSPSTLTQPASKTRGQRPGSRKAPSRHAPARRVTVRNAHPGPPPDGHIQLPQTASQLDHAASLSSRR